METRMLFAGFGGQGLLFMGKVLAYTGMLKDRKVTWIPSYGPEMRGGTANCSVIISEEEIASPMVNVPDILVAMNQPSLDKFAKQVRKGGLIIVNSSFVKNIPALDGVEVLEVPANDIAHEIGNVKIANMVVLGVLLKRFTAFGVDDLMQALAEIVPAKLLEVNKKAIEAGVNLE